MIRSFRDRDTERVFNRLRARKLGIAQSVAQRKLFVLDAAETLEDLNSPPGNRLEKLKGDRKGQHSIRINDRWRICFRWTSRAASDVEIVDYHKDLQARFDLETVKDRLGDRLDEEVQVLRRAG